MKAKAKKQKRLRAEPGEYVLTGKPELIVRRAKEVEMAMARLPAGALHTNQKEAIRRNLSVVTDGEVGGYKFKLKDRKAAKQSAAKSLKRTAGELAKKAAEKMAEQAGTAAWIALVEALRRLVDLLS